MANSDIVSYILILCMYALVMLASVVCYMAPTIVAYIRKHPSVLAIGATNFIFGWTGLGWLVSLIWALTATHRRDS